MADNKAYHAAIALIKVKGKVIGKIRNLRGNEQYNRIGVQGVGTIFESEAPVTKFNGSCSCSLIEINFKEGGLPGAVNRKFGNVESAVLAGESSFEDQIVLDDEGIQIDLFKKVADVIDPSTGVIKPKLNPYATISHALIETDGFDISEGNLVGRDQSFKYLKPITYLS
jgi:hypothetical protein